MSVILRARWVLPIDHPPIRDGWVEVGGGGILSLGRGGPPAGDEVRDLGEAALLPGLVNAHTHVELSWMARRIQPTETQPEWIRAVLALRAALPRGGEAAAAGEPIQSSAATMRATGTVLVGDVSNDLCTPAALSRAGLGGVVFHELLGFNTFDPARHVREAWERVDRADLRSPLEASVVAHAPYSCSPALIHEVARRCRAVPLTMHVGESAEEIEFLRTGQGPFRDLLESLSVWTGEWEAPRCGPVEYLDRLGYLRPGMLAVHGVHLSDAELDRLRQVGAYLVTCPRSNTWVGTGLPRLTHMYASGVSVAIGTDSLASVPTLNLFDELAEMRRIAPDVAASALLESATRVGASALGFEPWYGTLASGKYAHFTLVDLPAGVHDVEEYLVSGVPTAAVRPLSP